ncbi:MAG: sugar phosphate isomerase/epimerase [Promethearchaeota archaeon]|nr:MAG: sugar phosphate isomerase/epimerase [Candidatus Lokiarchaeota archaeon]
MKLAINQATLMQTPMDIFLNAVSLAGFEGVELRRDQTFNYLKNHSVKELKKNLDANNLKCVTFNAIELFSLCPEEEFKIILDYTEKLMKIGNQIDCNTIISVPSFLNDLSMSEAKIISKTIERLERLAQLAEKYDFRLGFEPLGFINCSVRKIDLALKIIENEKLPEMGLIIDTFHYFIGEHSINQLNNIPLEKLWLIHINDAIEKPFKELQDSHRILPCQGFFNLEMFVNKLKEIGYNDWISLELFNEEIWRQDPYQIAKEAMTSIRKIIV